MKRTLSILIILALLLTVLPIAAFADGEIMGMWPDELPIDTTDCSVGEDGDTIDFGDSLSWDTELPRDYGDYDYELPIIDFPAETEPATAVESTRQYVTSVNTSSEALEIFQELWTSFLEEEVLSISDSIQQVLFSFGK